MKLVIARASTPDTDLAVTFAYAPSTLAPGAPRHGVGELHAIEPTDPNSPATPRRTLVVGLGEVQHCNAETIRKASGAAAKWMWDHRVRSAHIDLSDIKRIPGAIKTAAACEGLSLGAFRFDSYRSSDDRAELTCTVNPGPGSAGAKSAAARAETISAAVNLARAWGHEPPNVVNPITLAARVRTMARKTGLACTVLDDKQLTKLNANALVQVGIGSKTPSRLIILEHAGSGRAAQEKPVVLVGKAITFDTGGYSLKNTTGIVGMKYDKCGGMAVVGALKAAADLKMKRRVVGVIAAAENMISRDAYRPNDIVTTLSGKTVEIISTDAEGRLVLADALTYAQQHYKPAAIIDLATLTGGVITALGNVRAGLFANHDALARKLFDAGQRVHERLWRLPLDDEYLEPIKGDDSDLKNSGGRMAHPIIGGMFLKQFVDDAVPWAHLDIAGVADTEKDMPYCPKGATGFGVRLLMEYLSEK